MVNSVRSRLKAAVNHFGYSVSRFTRDESFPVEASAAERQLMLSLQPYTMSRRERLWALIQATQYIVKADIPGDFVECGVWRGGSAMAMASTLLHCNGSPRKIWLYDTFEGMTPPTDFDVRTSDGVAVDKLLAASTRTDEIWCVAPEEDVRANLLTTGYDPSLIELVKGDVSETLKTRRPKQIALLRLDTDWYESTRDELDYLYPLVSVAGVVIVDDYGHYDGARKAVDDFLSRLPEPVLVHYIDYTARSWIKPSPQGA